MKHLLRSLGTILLMACLAGPVHAAGSDDDSPPKRTNPSLAAGETLVKAGKFAEAVPLLEKAIRAEPRNADAQNYLGYSLRKLGDTEGALKHYGLALDIEPRHLGANEYLGELYLEMDELEKAEQRLDVLDSACFFGCEEYTELKEAITAYKANNGD